MKFHTVIVYIEACRGAGAKSVAKDANGCGFDPFNISSFWCRGKVRRCFHYSTRNASKTRQKIWNGVS